MSDNTAIITGLALLCFTVLGGCWVTEHYSGIEEREKLEFQKQMGCPPPKTCGCKVVES